MDVKGTAFLARKAMLVREIGDERFNNFMRAISQQEPFFRQPILATTSIPIAAFLRFNDELVKDIYQGDWNSLWRFGEKSAEWAFTEGPHKSLLASKNVQSFVDAAVPIYRNYFSRGSAHASLKGDVVEFRIVDVPQPYRHLYMEYALAGYFKRGLELVGARSVEPRRLKGFANGDSEAVYEFRLLA